MSEYLSFLETKKTAHIPSGFSFDDFHPKLFDWQQLIVKWALQRGRSAIFADTGLGKTYMQVQWAHAVTQETNRMVLIFAPLCVAHQTARMAKDDLGIDVHYTRSQKDCKDGINITNYEMLEHFDCSQFVGVVLDEASIIKSYDGKTTDAILDFARYIPYRLSCTATPSPNDYMELGNQAEFVGVMSREEMLAMFFIHDGGDTAKWRLKGHGEVKFWQWLSTWAVVIRKPSDLGFDDAGYDLPPLIMHEHIIRSDADEGNLFAMPALGLTEQRKAKRASMNDRVNSVAELVNESPVDEPWMVWCHLNDESKLLGESINNSVTVAGSDSIQHKEDSMDGFSDGSVKKLISKQSICGFGMNWQHCNNTAFVGIDHSFEGMYQAIRRFYRFGQTNPVNVHLFLSESEVSILENLKRKEKQHNEMSARMVEHMQEFMKKEVFGMTQEKSEYQRKVTETSKYTLHLADCVDLASEIETGSIDYTIFSPPFASLYTYSNSDRDMGNSKGNEFYDHFKFLVAEMFRITRPGRLLSFHCMNLPTSKQNDGFIGIKDFRGELIRMFIDAGWIYHSEVVIWKDPVTAMQRTKALGLLHKTIRKDSAMSRQGIPDYLVTMRKPGDNDKPIQHYRDEKECADNDGDESKIFPVQLWQNYASPVWFDINPSRTLQYRAARQNEDERHICPLQLDVIERAMNLWTAKDDLVFSPFTGIGSEGYTAVKMGRRFIGSELKESYYDLAVSNIAAAERESAEVISNLFGEDNDNI